MTEEKESGGCSCGCGGCVMFIIFILLFWAIFFGLPINDKVWNIDLIPPRIWNMNEKVVDKVEVKEKVKEEKIKDEPENFKQTDDFGN